MWREQAREFADTSADVVGNSYARVGAVDGPAVLLLGHIDEIGLIVTHIDEDGLLRVRPLGTWDERILRARRVRIRTADGRDVPGVLGVAPVHLLASGAGKEPFALGGAWIDVGAADADEAKALVSVGDVAVADAPPLRLGKDRLTSRALDNRLGALAVLEIARRCEDAAVPVVAAAPVLEETTMDGGRVAAHTVQPAVTIVLDVTHAAIPGSDPGTIGEVRLGAGPSICRGLALHPGLAARLTAIARDNGIPHVIEALPGTDSTLTDADGALDAHAGSAVALIGLPLRHMHSPAEVCDLGDLAAAIELVTALVTSLRPDDDWTR